MTSTPSVRRSGRMHRVQIIRAMIDVRGQGLEIGPSFRPILPKAKGFNVRTVDHASAEELRQKYRGKPAEVLTRIEDVDFVWAGGSLVDLVGASGRFDWIVASHVIEHVPDIVRFFRDCGTLLKKGGVLALAVPDKSFCMDYLRPCTTTGVALQAYIEGRNKHTFATILRSK